MSPVEPSRSSGFLREASARFGVSAELLEILVRAARQLSSEELGVVQEMLHLADAGVSPDRRNALSRGVVRALEAVPSDASPDPLADVDDPMSTAEAAESLTLAEMETQHARESLLRDCVSVAEAARRTGRSRQALERLRREDRLLALRIGAQWRYPSWQFDPDSPGGILPGLSDVLRHLHLSPAGAALWLLRPAERLGGAPPIELLRRHRPEPVVQWALEQGHLP